MPVPSLRWSLSSDRELESLLKRFFGRVDLYPVGETIELGYSSAGATVGVEVVTPARRVEIFVREARVEVTRIKDGAHHILDWGAFRPPGIVFGTPANLTLEIPAGFLLETKTPRRLNVAFNDRGVRDEIDDVIGPLRQDWFDQLRKLEIPPDSQNPGRPVAFEQLYDVMSKSPRWVEAWTALQRRCYWSPGRYKLRIVFLTAEPEKTIDRTLGFEISQKDSELLYGNATTMLRQNVGQQDWSLYFARVKFATPAST